LDLLGKNFNDLILKVFIYLFSKYANLFSFVRVIFNLYNNVLYERDCNIYDRKI